MRIVIFGATGMVGSGVLLECLEDPGVTDVVSVVRRSTGRTHPKLREIAHADFTDFSSLEEVFAGVDACFYCVGVTSVGMTEAAYSAVTYDMTVAAANTLVKASPQLTFCFVSGTGADSSERGRVMWARVKGRAENAVLALQFRQCFVFRPALIQPLKGVQSRTRWYQLFYMILSPLMPVFRRVLPNQFTTTVAIGQAMLNVTRQGFPKRILQTREINRAAIGARLEAAV